MVGIVIASHSAALASSIRELALQMVADTVPIAVAGGIDDPQGPLGTDAVKIKRAIESVYSDDGVLVLMDLGSALLSAQTAVELLPERMRSKVRLCTAAIVEGAVAAAVQAGTGADLEQVDREAGSAVQTKSAHFGTGEAEARRPPSPGSPDTAGRELVLTVSNRLGIHARPAARLVSAAAGYRAEICCRNITRDSGWANTASINQLTMLDARKGHQLALRATGPQAGEALAGMAELITRGFAEIDGEEQPLAAGVNPPASPEGEGSWLIGTALSPGYALGPAAVLKRRGGSEIPRRDADDPAKELDRLEAVLAEVRGEYRNLQEILAAAGREYEGEIFAAYGLYLDDPESNREARENILRQNATAETAWQSAIDRLIRSHDSLEVPYMRERALDLGDVRDRVLERLLGEAGGSSSPEEPSVLMVAELNPAEIMRIETEKILGICSVSGSPDSHGAILARALGIPAVSGLPAAAVGGWSKRSVAVDGTAGAVLIDPDAGQRRELESRRAGWLEARERERESALLPAVTRDGRRIEVRANIIGTIDARAALRCGADGIGLLRTEFLFLDRSRPPEEQEQYQVYREIAGILGDRPLVIRTFDLGADKIPAYLSIHTGDNPALGQRGVRIYRRYPELLIAQLRAIVRAANGHQLGLLIPAVSTVAELRFVKTTLEEVRQELLREGVPLSQPIPVGVMIEVPAAALLADQLAGESDFFSIGTNDLCQYTLAADRGGPEAAGEYDCWQPALLRLIRQTVAAAHTAGIPVGICGEMAGDPEAAALLAGLELDQLSMNPNQIGSVKRRIADITFQEARETALQSLKLESAAAVRRFYRQRHGGD